MKACSFSRQCSLQAAEKNQKTASKVTKLGNKKQKWTDTVSLAEATIQAPWHLALQPECGSVGPGICPAPSTRLIPEPSGALACRRCPLYIT